jgi:hypothetical protein
MKKNDHTESVFEYELDIWENRIDDNFYNYIEFFCLNFNQYFIRLFVLDQEKIRTVIQSWMIYHSADRCVTQIFQLLMHRSISSTFRIRVELQANVKDA